MIPVIHDLHHLDYHELAKFRRVEFLGGGSLRHSHHLNLVAIENLTRLLPTAFGYFILAWPILSVTGTTITADIAPVSQGEAMGLFNASGAVGTVLGTFAGGPLVHALGYVAVSLLGVGGLGASLALALLLKVPPQVGEGQAAAEPDAGSPSST